MWITFVKSLDYDQEYIGVEQRLDEQFRRNGSNRKPLSAFDWTIIYTKRLKYRNILTGCGSTMVMILTNFHNGYSLH